MYLREILYQDQRLGAVQEAIKVSSRLQKTGFAMNYRKGSLKQKSKHVV